MLFYPLYPISRADAQCPAKGQSYKIWHGAESWWEEKDANA